MPNISCCLCRSKTPDVSLFHFPKDSKESNVWKERCDIRLTDDVSRFVVCSKHFTSNDYVEPNAKKFGGRLMLKPERFPTLKVPNPVINAVPSTSYEPAIQIVEVSSLLIDAVPPTSYEPAMQIDPILCTPKKRKFAEPRYVGDIQSSDFATPKRARRAWHLAKEEIISLRKTVRTLRSENSRLNTKIASLKDTVKHLKKNNSLSEDAADPLMVTKSLE